MHTNFRSEAGKRRTFAIISHPDAGKTTITEKILYECGVLREANEVDSKNKKPTTSDWMGMEQERGVSITSSVMQFDYQGLRINLLDTPGHKDFGEDTYRTLIAADSAAMLIDAAKGVEVQTRKLFEVCHLRKIPIFTFANKMDRDGKEPLEIIDDVENTLGIKCYPVTWPLGMGSRFVGLYHRLKKQLLIYTKGSEKAKIIPVKDHRDPQIKPLMEEDLFNKFQEDLDLIEGVLDPFDETEFLKGRVSPMTFGSAKFNWGVDLFLELFSEKSPAPGPRNTSEGLLVQPNDKYFSGFVFKIQANMDPKHRDRVAFVRVCSGRFERGMRTQHIRLKRDLRLSYANQFMAKDRKTVDEAYAGDIVGITDTGLFQIGDSLSSGPKIHFGEMPRFPPEVFAKLSIANPLKRKQLQKAILQLSQEGVVQLFHDPLYGPQNPILGVVGELQFDVLLYRLNDEYKLDVKLDKQAFSVARWITRKEDSTTSEDLGHTRLSHASVNHTSVDHASVNHASVNHTSVDEDSKNKIHRPANGKSKENRLHSKASQKKEEITSSSLKGGRTLYKDSQGNPVVLLEREWDLNWLIKENPDLSFHFTGQTNSE